ncbi:probable inactive purple acid phosphatase 24 isoform X2 [Gastrolobium bilobum]|uniref:probable inactive purple acid phosphatase 24 isoform X2 n=1 Tax=Gastrolobium bilobum TaxID=150636 RepID=UPI002AB14F71|nr:probable inactive purple acid phosphatase 24 isoform X2 [Gastrolobium bilobum]
MEGSVGNMLKLNMIIVILWFSKLSMGLVHNDMNGFGEQPLSKIAIHKTILALRSSASITAAPYVLGNKGEDTEWVTVELKSPEPSIDDWVNRGSHAALVSGVECLAEK